MTAALEASWAFDRLYKFEIADSVKGHPIAALLEIFRTGGLSEYRSWESTHADAVAKHISNKSYLEHKIRLLSLATLAFEHVGRELPYASVASTLEIPETEVERWVIDAIRAGLVSGKLSQTSRTVHIIRATARSFGREQWEILEQRILAWKAGLSQVIDAVSAAQKTGGKPTAVAQTDAAAPATKDASQQTAAVGA
jgi:translation initiation factor 3 subunit M